jgi:hypothetical protein
MSANITTVNKPDEWPEEFVSLITLQYTSRICTLTDIANEHAISYNKLRQFAADNNWATKRKKSLEEREDDVRLAVRHAKATAAKDAIEGIATSLSLLTTTVKDCFDRFKNEETGKTILMPKDLKDMASTIEHMAKIAKPILEFTENKQDKAAKHLHLHSHAPDPTPVFESKIVKAHPWNDTSLSVIQTTPDQSIYDEEDQA